MTAPALQRSSPSNLLLRLSPTAATRAVSELVQRQLNGPESVPNAHPATADLESLRLEDRSLESLLTCLDPEVSSGRRHWSRSGLLGDIVGPSLVVASRQYPSPGHRAFCRVVSAPDFRPFRLVGGLDTVRIVPQFEAGELPNSILSDLQWEPAQALAFSGFAQLWKSDMADDRDLGILSRANEALLSASYRHEQNAIFTALTSDPSLRDTGKWFDATNSTSGTAFTWSDVQELAHLLASRADGDGQPSGLTGRYLLIPSDPTKFTLVESAKPSTLPADLTIIASPHLTTTAFLLADPQTAPSLALAVLNPTPTLEIRNRIPLNLPAVGVELSVQNSYAVTPLSRRGICRWSLTP